MLLLCLAVLNTAWAAPISERQARTIAADFMAARSMPSSGLMTAHKAPMLNEAWLSTGKTAYYVFNAAQAGKGYVIVAADDRVPAILGYSDSGTFDAQDVPPAMQDWLDGYALQVEAIARGAAPELRSATRAAIEPMLSVRWGQGLPYNVLLPHINGSSNDHAYVGCVAVAMAQIMGYWQYPPRATQTIPKYTSNVGMSYAVTMPALAPIDFDWDNMHETYYTNDSTSNAALAVANLMLYATTSVRSNFGLTSTSSYTSNIPEKLITYFGYKNSAHFLRRSNFVTQAWEDTIYNELAAGRPVAYGGNKKSSGHAFVCDGYDGEGRFHINWGWAGKSNGYFLLNLLNPSDEGIGSAAGAYGYVYNQGIGIGIEPADGTTGTAAFSFEELSYSSANTTRSAASSNFSVSVSGRFINNTNVASRFRQGWGLYQDGELIKVLYTANSSGSVGNGQYITVSNRSLSFGSGITSGTYRIMPIYAIYPGEDYRPCIGSDVNYIEVNFNGTYSCSIKGYGTAGLSSTTGRYTVNSCTTEGTLNHGKPVTVDLNLTNTGTSTNDMVYMFVDGEFAAMGLANIGSGETGDIVYRFTPTTPGTKTLTFSLNEGGTPTLYTKKVTIATMPAATLNVSYRIQGISDEENRIITADKYSIIVDVTNTGTTTYDEDFSVRLYRINNDDTNVGTELFSQSQPLHLAAGATTSLLFDFDQDLINGWKYFCYLYYYSSGEAVGTGTKWYYLYLTDAPDVPHYYHVSTTSSLHGTVNFTGGVMSNKAQAGSTVSVATNPNVGWKNEGITVTTGGGSPVEVTATGGGNYTFVMPEGDVDVSADFARSTGSLFKRVETRDSITEGAIYVLVSDTHGKVMKQWSEDNATFQAADVVSRTDDDPSIISVGDDAFFFTLTQVTDTTVSGNARTAAYLTNGNAYMRTSNYNVLMQGNIAPESRAWMYIGNGSNCLIRFKDSTSGSNGNWIVRYDNENDEFKVMNWNVTDAETSRIWLYKLAETPAPDFELGDVNRDGYVNISDVATLIDYMLDDSTEICLPAADVDSSGNINIADVTALIDLLLGS